LAQSFDEIKTMMQEKVFFHEEGCGESFSISSWEIRFKQAKGALGHI